MSSEETYRHGLEKLGLLCEQQASGNHEGPCPRDLRRDPAFAWRVLEAFGRNEYEMTYWTSGNEYGLTFGSQVAPVKAATMADALYAAVCELGRQG